jgi:hypothetical protein
MPLWQYERTFSIQRRDHGMSHAAIATVQSGFPYLGSRLAGITQYYYRVQAALLVSVLVLASTAIRACGQGVILWDESASGELSQDFTHPTSLTPVQPGTNSIIGQTESIPWGGGWISYGDNFLMTIPTNLSISALYLTVSLPNVWAWIGNAPSPIRSGGR